MVINYIKGIFDQVWWPVSFIRNHNFEFEYEFKIEFEVQFEIEL